MKSVEDAKTIFEYVARQRDNYRNDTITEGYDFSQYETLRTIELYDNDRFITGNKDELEREKPFFNIVSFRKNVATRATDLDTKDVQIHSDRIASSSVSRPRAWQSHIEREAKSRPSAVSQEPISE